MNINVRLNKNFTTQYNKMQTEKLQTEKSTWKNENY